MNKQKIIGYFKELEKIARHNKDIHRANAYKNAIQYITIVNGKDNDITKEDLPDLKNDIGKGKGIGAKTYAKVEEFFLTQKISKVEKVKKEMPESELQKIEIIESFAKIPGIGQQTAKKWYEYGYKSYDDLIKNKVLTNTQQIGLRYLDQISMKIPRFEIQFYDVLVKFVIEQMQLDQKYKNCKIEHKIAGSYLRGAKQSGDIDIVIYSPEISSGSPQKKTISQKCVSFPFKEIIQRLEKNGILLEGEYFSKGNIKYLGYGKLTNKYYINFIRSKLKEYPSLQSYLDLPVRRIDIHFVTRKYEYPFTLLYFTGPDTWNRQMRKVAKTQGYTLSEHGLKDRKTSKYIDHNKFKTEKDIFDFLGLEYSEPKYR